MVSWQQISEDLGEAWDSLMDGWRKLYRRAAGAITRFNPTDKGRAELTPSDAEEFLSRSAGWGVLACEVFDDDNRVVVRLEAPGMEKDDFDLQVVAESLLVRGQKQMARESSEGGYYISECAYGSFERVIPLPAEVDTDRATASYKHGVLQVKLPKTTPHKRRRIMLDAG